MTKNINFEVNDKEKKILDRGKANSECSTWKEYFINLVEEDIDD